MDGFSFFIIRWRSHWQYHVHYNVRFLSNTVSNAGPDIKPVLEHSKYNGFKANKMIVTLQLSWKVWGIIALTNSSGKCFSLKWTCFLDHVSTVFTNFVVLRWSRCFTLQPSVHVKICLFWIDRVSHVFSEVCLHSWVRINKTAV